jgi:O-antigen ligase
MVASITLVQLPGYLGHKSVLQPAVVIVLVVCVAWGLPRLPSGVLGRPAAIAGLVYALTIGVALLRGAHGHIYGSMQSAINQTTTYLIFVLLGAVAVGTAATREDRNRRATLVALAPITYVAVNVLMQLAGLHNKNPEGISAGYSSQLLGFLGLHGVREKLPLATSINLFSIPVAAGLAAVVALRLRAPGTISRALAWAAGGACVYALLLGDSRGALIVALAIIAWVLLSRRMAGASGVAAIVPLLPVIVILVVGFLGHSGAATELSRGSTAGTSIATATGRFYIWQGTWDVLKHFPVQEFYGWGAGGQQPSGASLHYAWVFPGNPRAISVFTHDIVLQTLVDTGIIGLIALVAALATTFVALQRARRADPASPAVGLVAALAVIVLSGASEVSPTYYSQEALLTVLLIMGAAAALDRARLDDEAMAARPPGFWDSGHPPADAGRDPYREAP